MMKIQTDKVKESIDVQQYEAVKGTGEIQGSGLPRCMLKPCILMSEELQGPESMSIQPLASRDPWIGPFILKSMLGLKGFSPLLSTVSPRSLT